MKRVVPPSGNTIQAAQGRNGMSKPPEGRDGALVRIVPAGIGLRTTPLRALEELLEHARKVRCRASCTP